MSHPTFPQSAFIGLGGDFAKMYAENVESPPEYLLMSFYTCMGIALSRYVTLDLAFDTPPRLYVPLLGESANDRKSTAQKLATNFWKDSPHFRTVFGAGSVEGLARDFHGRKKKEEPDKRPVLLVYDEFQSFVAKAGQRGSLLLPVVSTLFESDCFDNSTIRQKVELRGYDLAILAACTLDTYAEMWSSEFTNIGLPNRLFIVVGERTKHIALPKSPEIGKPERLRVRVEQTIAALKDKAAASGKLRLKLTPEAEQRWTHYYHALDKSVHAKRLDTYGFRWMVLFTIGQGQWEVTRETVDRVCDLLDYQLAVRKLYDPIDADNAVAKMEEKIRRLVVVPGQTYKRRYLQQRTNANKCGLWAFNMALTNLEAAREIENLKTKDGKRTDHFNLPLPVVHAVVQHSESANPPRINKEEEVLLPL